MATSETLSQIAASAPFQGRVRLAMVKQATGRFAGAEPMERALIQSVLRGNGPLLTWALAVVTHSGIASGTYSLDGADITDSAIDTAVQAIWPALVG
jgi:hypothetical protein